MQRRKCPQFTCDTCPGPQVSPRAQTPALAPRPLCPTPRPLPALPPPRRPSPRRSPGPRPLARPASGSLEPGRAARGGPSWRGLSPIITPRRLQGLPAPGNSGETRPGTPALATIRLLGYPPQAGHRNSTLRVATCPAPSQPGSAGRVEARRRVRPRKALHRRLTCRLLHLQCHPDTAPCWGMKAPATRPARPRHSRAGGLAPAAAAATARSAPAPPDGLGLEGRRMQR